ncbi:hypothetical protein BV898_16507 [Hypsibius exemplaris]|uniref:Phosphoribosyltransferase C-terminal domain-containing protein n=1 Tax=Hypsibius exemplaris TaxID=2072580 RepID=A0A9X6NDD1_HYPEX|nr:hypothetical protein BV898_16507 [Hypsibius exemplaris]
MQQPFPVRPFSSSKGKGEKSDDNVYSPGFFTKVFVDIPDAALHIQTLLRFAVDLYERLINILQFNEPWLATCLAVVLGAATVLTYLVPFRVLMILLGIHKFTKKIRNPNSIPHNDVVAFLSRARTNDKLRVHAELASQSLLQTSSRPSSNSNASNSSGGSNGTFVESTGRLERNDHAHRQRSSSWNLVGVEKMMKF